MNCAENHNWLQGFAPAISSAMLQLILKKLHANGMVLNAHRIRRDREFQEALVGPSGSVAKDDTVRRREQQRQDFSHVGAAALLDTTPLPV